MSIYLVAVVVYLILMALLGVYFAKSSIKNSDDFMVAGRSLPLWIVIGTLLATFVGSGTVVGGASFIYQYGPFAAIFNLSGGFVGAFILYLIASKVRQSEMYTVPQLLEKRFGTATRVIASIFILLAYVGITAYQFTGGAYVLQLTTGMPLEVGAIVMCALVIFLTMSGGLFSVAYSDALGAVLILIGFIIGIPFALNAAGGFSGLAEALPAMTKTWNGGLSIPQLLGFFLPLFLLVLGDQNMYQRFAAAKDELTAKRSVLGFIAGNALVVGLVIMMATTAIVLFPTISPDAAILTVAIEGVPVAIGVLILCASVAFLITTATSYLLSASGNIVYDLVQRFSKKELPEQKLLWLNRGTVLGLGVFAYVLGQFFPSVLAIQMYSYTMYGAAITPAIIATLLWKKATTAGIMSSIIVGGSATMFWELVLNRPFDWNSVLFALPLSVITLVVVSLATQKKGASLTLGNKNLNLE
ncbi:Propionate transporter [Bhargavaea cecembensis DSE10]|uniref:Propionate transporter n=1 Tax=Bhargavaea cecembensis DSE10 TaxID=1235279 RepID=M7NHC2_9BACL|nr:sodium:solute symporter family protein [Bhargavaea cecembensis]EMR06642.1 Propionate transporter [Bhargavaea cecembensis DSE10]